MASLLHWILRLVGAREPPPLSDDLLEQILLRIGSPVDLARASAACTTFRRLVTDPSFLRRYRSRHGPLLLGFIYFEPTGFEPVDAKHPNGPAARALGSAASFSFNQYLPCDFRLWDPCDVRDGRFLLQRSNPVGYEGFGWLDLAVCDPVSRRYLLLPHIPDNLLASLQIQVQNLRYMEPFLESSGQEEEDSFRVFVLADYGAKLVLFVFASTSSRWSLGASANRDAHALGLSLMPVDNFGRHHYANGCCFWRFSCGKKLLKLVVNSMEFSAVDLPPGHHHSGIAIVEAGDGRVGLFRLIKILGSTMIGYHTLMQSKGEGTDEWQQENMISLPSEYAFHFRLKGAPEGYIFLLGSPRVYPTEDTMCFSLDIKTLKIERVSKVKRSEYCDFQPYFGFPPSMSPRRI